MHEKLREEIMSSLARRPPPGYAGLTIQQVRKADEAAFILMAKYTASGIKKVGGKRPMDDAVEKTLAHRDFNIHLQPMQGKGHAESTEGQKRSSEAISGGASRNQKKKKQKALNNSDPQKALMNYPANYPARGSGSEGYSSSGGGGKGGGGKGRGSGGNKSGGTGDGGSARIPQSLNVSGASGRDSEGNAICYAYNLEGCSAAPPGGKCQRGRHVCILKTCGLAAHGYTAHHK